MFERALVMYIYAETPIHPGSGIALGAVDLPIQRERHTEFPMIQGSSLKGVMRNSARDVGITGKVKIKEESKEVEKEWVDIIFGEEDRVGGISATDARILAFPVRTLKGVFGWVTCPLVLDRYKRDLGLVGIEVDWDIPKPANNEEAKVCKDSNLTEEEHVYIEDLQLKCSEDENINKIANGIAKGLPNNEAYKELKEKLKKYLVVVSDEVFRDLVSLTTEVVTRIRIDPTTGTVDKKVGGLWSEEYLPTDTIMYFLILIPSRLNNLKPEDITKLLKKYDERILQIGGDETIGKGFAVVKLVEGGDRNVEKP
jgi:CRISPR-associated protein Cmr4